MGPRSRSRAHTNARTTPRTHDAHPLTPGRLPPANSPDLSGRTALALGTAQASRKDAEGIRVYEPPVHNDTSRLSSLRHAVARPAAIDTLPPCRCTHSAVYDDLDRTLLTSTATVSAPDPTATARAAACDSHHPSPLTTIGPNPSLDRQLGLATPYRSIASFLLSDP